MFGLRCVTCLWSNMCLCFIVLCLCSNKYCCSTVSCWSTCSVFHCGHLFYHIFLLFVLVLSCACLLNNFVFVFHYNLLVFLHNLRMFYEVLVFLRNMFYNNIKICACDLTFRTEVPIYHFVSSWRVPSWTSARPWACVLSFFFFFHMRVFRLAVFVVMLCLKVHEDVLVLRPAAVHPVLFCSCHPSGRVLLVL